MLSVCLHHQFSAGNTAGHDPAVAAGLTLGQQQFGVKLLPEYSSAPREKSAAKKEMWSVLENS